MNIRSLESGVRQIFLVGSFGCGGNAFENPTGNNRNYEISVPSGMNQAEFDQAVTNSGNSYSQGTYSLPGYGPNSNSAANNIIQNAGGTTPIVPGAWSQFIPAHGGDAGAVPGVP